jgi:hypothetical protein
VPNPPILQWPEGERLTSPQPFSSYFLSIILHRINNIIYSSP